MKNGYYNSTKKDSFLHGDGIAVIRKIAEKYGGMAEFEHAEDSFCVQVALKGIQDNETDNRAGTLPAGSAKYK